MISVPNAGNGMFRPLRYGVDALEQKKNQKKKSTKQFCCEKQEISEFYWELQSLIVHHEVIFQNWSSCNSKTKSSNVQWKAKKGASCCDWTQHKEKEMHFFRLLSGQTGKDLKIAYVIYFFFLFFFTCTQ